MKMLTTSLRAAMLCLLVTTTSAMAEDDPALEMLGKTTADLGDRMRGDRVVGGIEAPLNAYPFYVELRRFSDKTRYSLCGAAVISAKWVLTAAHCVQSRDKTTGRASAITPARSFRALPGGGARSNAPGIAVARVIPHPQYSAQYALQNDIALIELATPIGPPYLPMAKTEPQPGTPVRIVGYGLTAYKGKTSQRLREADTRLVSRRDCAIVSNTLKGAGPIDKRRICADVEGRTGLVDSCQGDSGGPLLQADTKGFWRAVGIVSYGHKCAEPGFPGVYTNVAAYQDWITSVINGGPPEVANPKPVSPPKPPPPVSEMPASAPTAITQLADLVDYGGISLGLTTANPDSVAAGAAVGFAVKSQLPGNLYVFDIGRDGDARQIFPNERTRKGRVKAQISQGKPRVVPSARDGFRLRAQARAGERWIVAIVIDGLKSGSRSGDLTGSMEEVAATRGLEPIADTGGYLREIVAALSKSCAADQIRCAFGSVRIRIDG